MRASLSVALQVEQKMMKELPCIKNDIHHRIKFYCIQKLHLPNN